MSGTGPRAAAASAAATPVVVGGTAAAGKTGTGAASPRSGAPTAGATSPATAAAVTIQRQTSATAAATTTLSATPTPSLSSSSSSVITAAAARIAAAVGAGPATGAAAATPSSTSSTSPESAAAAQARTEADLLAMLEAQNRMLALDARAVTTMTAAVDPPGRGGGGGGSGEGGDASENGSHGSESGLLGMEEEKPVDVVSGDTLMLHWIEALSTWDAFTKKRQKRLHELVMEGVPEQLRCMAWQLMAKSKAGLPADEPLASLIARDGSDSECPSYVNLLKLTSPHEKAITRDIDRTYPNHSFFAERGGMGQENLFNVIKAYSLYDTEVGYCQGCPFIVGVLLMHMPEDEAFYMFTGMMRDYRLRGLYRPSMADMPLRLFQLEGMIAQSFPDLHAHFSEIGVSVSTFASSWFLTLFGSTLPLPVVFRLLDVFFIDGMHVIFRAAMSILTNSHDYLLRNNVEGVLRLLMKNGLAEKYKDKEVEFMQEFADTKVDHRRLQKLEKDYIAAKLKTDQEHSEMTKKDQEIEHLRAENKSLKEKVALLEREMQLMANKLLNTSVSLNKKEEEIFDMRQAMARSSAGNVAGLLEPDQERLRGKSPTGSGSSGLLNVDTPHRDTPSSSSLLGNLRDPHGQASSSSGHSREHSTAKETLNLAKDAIMQLLPQFGTKKDKETHGDTQPPGTPSSLRHDTRQ